MLHIRLAAFVMIGAVCFAQTPASEPVDIARMEEVIDGFVDDNTFMGTVLVARGDDVLLSKGYGSANIEWNIPNRPDTKFRLGSVTKQFTAASVLLLEERGELSVDDLVSVHLSDVPETWEKITIRHLLNHTAGLPNFTSLAEYREMKVFPMTVAEVVAKFSELPLEFEPGEKMKYSNSGYLLLGYLIEEITEASYAEFVNENIFTALGMADSGYDSNSAIITRRASGYSPSADGPVNTGFIHMSIPHAAGALYSTTEDLLKWERALYGGEVLSARSLEKMTTPKLNDYGFGVTIQDSDGRKQFSHGGGIEGFNTLLACYPDTEIAVIVLGNLNGMAPGQIAAQLGKVAHGEEIQLTSERREVTLELAQLEEYVGTYQLAPQVTLSVTLDGEQLMTQLSGQRKLRVFPESEDSFFLKVVDAQLEFVRGDDGAVSSVILHQNGRHQNAPRVSDTVSMRTEIAVAVEILETYVGSYKFRPGMDMVVTLEDGQLMTQLGPQPKLPIFAESDTSFFAKVVDAQIEFTKDETGVVNALVLHQGPRTITAHRK